MADLAADLAADLMVVKAVGLAVNSVVNHRLDGFHLDGEVDLEDLHPKDLKDGCRMEDGDGEIGFLQNNHLKDGDLKGHLKDGFLQNRHLKDGDLESLCLDGFLGSVVAHGPLDGGLKD